MKKHFHYLLPLVSRRFFSYLISVSILLSIIASLLMVQPAFAWDDINVAGAGTGAVNGNYYNDGLNMNGKPSYENQSTFHYKLHWLGGTINQWWLYEIGNVLYYNDADTPYPPQTGWKIENGTGPAPTLSGPESYASPIAESFVRHDPITSPTNASVLIFRATFNVTVFNVSTGDFDVVGSTASVTNVSPVTGSVYDVTVAGGNLATYTGSVGLDLSGSQDIEDVYGLPLQSVEPAIDELYDVDHRLLSFERLTPITEDTNADSLTFRVSFAVDMQNVDGADFDVHGSSTATITDVVPVSAQVYDVTASGGDLAGYNGQVGLDLSGAQDIEDLGSNPLLTAEPLIDETYQVDNTAPSTDSFLRQTPFTSPTNADTLVFQASFSEDVFNVDLTDFAVNGGTTATVTSVVNIDQESYDVTVSGGDLAGYDGVVGLDLSGGQDIADVAGNPLSAVEPTLDQTYDVDNTPPTLDSFERSGPSPTNNDWITFKATFDEYVVDVDVPDFSVDGGTTATVTNVSFHSAGVHYVTVDGGDLAGYNGTVGLNLSGAQNIMDLAGNPLPAGEPAVDELFTMDNDPPAVLSFERYNPSSADTNADTLVFRVAFNDDMQLVGVIDFEVNGGSTATVTGISPVSASVYDVTVSGGDLAGYNGTVGIDFSGFLEIYDIANNPLPPGEPPIDETYQLDNTPPVLDSFTRQNPASSPTAADTLVFRALFSENVANVDAGDFIINSTSTATVTSMSWVSGSTVDVTVSGGDLVDYYGIVGVNLSGSQDISDLVGNPLPAGEPAIDETYLVDNSAFDRVGSFSPALNRWYLKTAHSNGWVDLTTLDFGVPDITKWMPVSGDWDGDGIDNAGFYSIDQKQWYLKTAHSDGWVDLINFQFGVSDITKWVPVSGDWDGDGIDTVGFYGVDQKRWYLKTAHSEGWTDLNHIKFGVSDITKWVPISGDWDGDGTDTIGFYSIDHKRWYLKTAYSDGWGDLLYLDFGVSDITSWTPVSGDWDGDFTDTVGFYNAAQRMWYLKTAYSDGWGDLVPIKFGSSDPNWKPVTGDW